MGVEVRRVFLYISKAFDKAWHNGVFYNLKQVGTSGDLLSVLTNFVTCRKQRVVLNGQYSSRANVEAEAPLLLLVL